MDIYDDELTRFEATGAPPLPATEETDCNMDPRGVHPFETTPSLDRCFSRHAADYELLSATPKQFVEDVSLMQRTQPNYSKEDLAKQRARPVVWSKRK